LHTCCWRPLMFQLSLVLFQVYAIVPVLNAGWGKGRLLNMTDQLKGH
jgi:hypothetical protein